uniref:Uncharacterized protein n=1 Tax=Theropithecus gelada TaxID=9565 RepID=A0A8D2G5N3_THEGE
MAFAPEEPSGDSRSGGVRGCPSGSPGCCLGWHCFSNALEAPEGQGSEDLGLNGVERFLEQ